MKPGDGVNLILCCSEQDGHKPLGQEFTPKLLVHFPGLGASESLPPGALRPWEVAAQTGSDEPLPVWGYLWRLCCTLMSYEKKLHGSCRHHTYRMAPWCEAPPPSPWAAFIYSSWICSYGRALGHKDSHLMTDS